MEKVCELKSPVDKVYYLVNIKSKVAVANPENNKIYLLDIED